MTHPRQPRRIRARWLALIALGPVALSVLVPACVLGVAYLGVPARATGSTGHDALWMGHAWVDGRRDAADIKRLARRLRSSGISDVYVHVGPLADDGRLDPGLHPRSAWLLERFSRALPEVRVSAWLGNVVGPDGLDLSRKTTRSRILHAARAMLREGFDGIHYDFEPVPSGSRGYLRLLAGTAQLTRSRGGVLSVAAEPTEPFPRAAPLSERLARPLYWTGDYLHAVATRVDQVAIMTYDSGMPLETLYGGYVARQTERALRIVPSEVTLLIGAPAYHDDTLFYRPYAESVATTVRGVRLALTDRPGNRANVGIALYVDFAATPRDWREYVQGWFAPTNSARRS